MNIFRFELKSYQKSTLTWSLALSAGVVVFLGMFPAFTKDIEASRKLMENFPPAIRDALGISLSNFFTIYGFYAYLFTFIALIGAIQAMNVGVGILSKEISGKTADFLLSKPVSRGKIMTEKILAALSTLIFTNIVFILVSIVMARIVASADLNYKIFLLISSTLFLVQLMFLALGVLMGVIIPKIKSIIAVSLPTVFTFFIIGTLGAIIGDAKVRYLTPFKFYDPMYIINNGSLENKFLIIEATFIIVSIVASFIIYLKKDIPSNT